MASVHLSVTSLLEEKIKLYIRPNQTKVMTQFFLNQQFKIPALNNASSESNGYPIRIHIKYVYLEAYMHKTMKHGIIQNWKILHGPVAQNFQLPWPPAAKIRFNKNNLNIPA